MLFYWIADLLASTSKWATCHKNGKELHADGLLEKFKAEQDMALLQNCRELQVCVGNYMPFHEAQLSVSSSTTPILIIII